MDEADILAILSSSSWAKESSQTASLRQKAHDLISTTEPSNLEHLPDTLLDLLTQIIRPLFTSTKHPSLTSTGRKNLLPEQSSSGIPTRFANPLIYEDDEAALLKPWKTTPMTIPLLRHILQQYSLPEPLSLRKATLESHFHLLVPAVLNMIDDTDPTYKAVGCALLRTLCETLRDVQSDMVRRTGLGDVFADALRANFMLLPTLTPEEESLEVLREVYPAYLALVDAWFPLELTKLVDTRHHNSDSADDSSKRRQKHLTALYRHGVTSSLSHLSSASAETFSNTISVPLTTFLLLQIPPIFTRMGISAVRHLQTLLPMLRAGLMDPFALAAPEMVCAALDVLVCVVTLCAVRVRDRWAPEILRGVVGCWCNLVDEREANSRTTKDGGVVSGSLEDVRFKLREVVKVLGQTVRREDWGEWKEKLVSEESDLKDLLIRRASC